MRKYIALMLMVCATPAWAMKGAGEVGQGNRLYRQQKYQQALEQYEKAEAKNPSEAKIAYDLGAAAYKTGDYDKAVQYFQKGLLSDDDVFKRDVQYNLGGAFYKAGVAREDNDVADAIKQLKASLDTFEKARAAAPDDKDVVNNYEFVKKELQRLEQKQQQQQQQNKQQKQDQQNQKQGQQGQDQQQQDQQKEDAQQKDQENSDQQQQQKSQEEKQQGQPKDQQKDQAKDQPASGQEGEGQISSQKDAQAMVDDFERNELPKGLLNFAPRQAQEHSVEKDW